MKKEYISPLARMIQTLPLAFVCVSPGQTTGERDVTSQGGGGPSGIIDDNDDDDDEGSLSRKMNFWE
jgi:hypothetical protein